MILLLLSLPLYQKGSVEESEYTCRDSDMGGCYNFNNNCIELGVLKGVTTKNCQSCSCNWECERLQILDEVLYDMGYYDQNKGCNIYADLNTCKGITIDEKSKDLEIKITQCLKGTLSTRIGELTKLTHFTYTVII